MSSGMANHLGHDDGGYTIDPGRAIADAAFNALPEAAVLTDVSGGIVRVNPAFVALFGYHPEALLGRPIDALYASGTETGAQSHLPSREDTRECPTPREARYRRANGAVLIGEAATTVVKDAAGQVLGALYMVRDVTERKQADTILETNLALLAKKHRYQSILTTVARSVHQSTSLQAVLENAVEAMQVSIERIDGIEVFMVEGEEAALKAHTGLPGWLIEKIRRLPAPQGYTWKVIRDGKPRYCADVDQDRFIHPVARAFGIKSYLSMPITAEGKAVGTININSFQTNAFDDEELHLLELISKHIEIAINNARQAEALRQALAEVERLKNRLQAENVYLQEELTTVHHCGEFIGTSNPLREVLRRVEQVAPTDATVLIQGETGTGKELIARAIHRRSRHRDRPLVKVNCAALPAGLIESELFGHEKGAFTGAIARKIGRFELADGGTLFLDEVGELPLELQAKLLRVLQEGEFERVGGSHTITARVRVIAATNRNLAEAVKVGAFRADLFYRLNVFPLTLPPLRERKDDIPLLVQCALERFAKKFGKPLQRLSDESLGRVMRYSWPGNVRELQNVLERAAILARGPVVEIDEALDQRLSENEQLSPVMTLQEVERAHILRVLDETHGIIEGPRGAARILGLHPNTLRSRLQKIGIKPPRDRS
jgi:formate hydrogenlyase transcriptional activator